MKPTHFRMPIQRALTRACILLLTMLSLPLGSCRKEEVVATEPPPRPIKVYRLGGQSGNARPDYPGRVQSTKTVELSFEVPGSIIDWNVEEGQRVKKGEILSRLDPTDYRAQLEAARARLRLAEAEYQRQSKLFASGSATQRDLDVAIRQRDVARADTRIAQKAVNDTKLRALFDGVIARKLVTDYRNVSAREPVLLLQDDSVFEVVIDVPEGDIARRSDGDVKDLDVDAWNRMAKPVIEFASVPGRTFPAKLKEFATVADPSTRTYRATFTLERPRGTAVLAGMTTKLTLTGLQTTASEDQLVPAQAVVGGADGSPYVWVVDEATMTVSRRPVEVGRVTEDRIVVTEGLQRGDVVATTGVNLLTDGTKVAEMEISDETRR